ncbi:MAG: tetratricopeptide repeat protein [Burkholderiales bacterium]
MPNGPDWRRRAAEAVLAAALVTGAALPCQAVEEETDPLTAADPDFAAGRKAIDAKNWNAAIKFFTSAALRAPDNADIQNVLGFAYRKAGKLDPAFKHYRRALELNPRHRGAHEYIGEAYLIAGDLASARKHLEELRKICLLPCEELADLEREIAAYIKKSAAGGSR